ncbi:MAG TPA: hypothetical protein VMW58_06370, partial [Anaerolineae bacterium]|nr:hypothetical protein [Anaerolineae bacterium]
DVVPPTAMPGATEVSAETPVPTATSRPTAPPEPTATPAPTETPVPAAAPDVTADFVAFEHTTFTLRLPGDWYSDAAYGLGFFATDAGLQDTWYSEAGPVVPAGALVVVLVGTRGDLGIGAEDSASDAMIDRTSETSEGCVAIEDPAKTTINGQDGTTGLWTCTSAEGLSTTLLSAIILSEDRAASLTGIIAAESEAELLAIVRAIIDSFQFVEN